ncbi:recombinase family protein [Paenibacillus koleovorans]|uniref:recombinase family protein n=1 Tax=Paenibacillus koleovorans TaxID=121608 RepID=UPI001FE7CC59|nr:recombinase family protein [Paenibacillus koleovorans]
MVFLRSLRWINFQCQISRLSRKIYDVVTIADFLEKNSTCLISTEDKIDTSTPMGKYFLVLASIFADMERENIIVQVKGGMSQKAREGEWNGGTAPFGYDLVDKCLVINEEEAKEVQFIYAEYLKGNGYNAIANLLNNKGVKTKKGNEFYIAAVKDILKNVTYAGKIRWGHRKDWGKRTEENKRKRKYNDDPIISEGVHEPIIDMETYDKVQAKIEGNPRRHVRQFDGKHLLSGLLRCPACDGKMFYQPVKSKGTLYGYYKCGTKGCKERGIRSTALEEEFVSIFGGIINQPEFKTEMLASLNSADDQIVDLQQRHKRVAGEISKLERKQDNLFAELTEGDDKYRSVVRKRIQDNLEEIEGLQKQQQEINQDIESIQSSRFNIDEISDLFQNVGKIIGLMDKEAQQKLVRKLVTRIDLVDGRITEVHFCFQQSFRIGGGKGNPTISDGL